MHRFPSLSFRVFATIQSTPPQLSNVNFCSFAEVRWLGYGHNGSILFQIRETWWEGRAEGVFKGVKTKSFCRCILQKNCGQCSPPFGVVGLSGQGRSNLKVEVCSCMATFSPDAAAKWKASQKAPLQGFWYHARGGTRRQGSGGTGQLVECGTLTVMISWQKSTGGQKVDASSTEAVIQTRYGKAVAKLSHEQEDI